MLSRIFDPMKGRRTRGGRPDSASSHLGLGLYIGERIVSGHGGTVGVASSESAGTTSSIRLPRSV